MSDIESILDDLEKCQEESSVDPEIADDVPNTPDNIPINSESRALSLDKKRNTRTNSSQNIYSPKLSETDGLKFGNSSPFINNNTLAPPDVTGSPLSPSSPSGKPFVSSPVRMNGHMNGLWENPTMMAKSPVIDRTSFPFPSHFRETSDSLDSESSTSVSSPGHKTPGSINLMQQRVNGVSRDHGGKHGVNSLRNHGDTNGVDRSPQMRGGNLRRGLNTVEHEVDLSHDIDETRDLTHDQDPLRRQDVTIRSRSVSFGSIADSDDTTDHKDRRPNDVETFHALIQNTRGSRRTLYTRGDNGNINKRFSKSEEILQSVGKAHEPREIFSMEFDTDTNSMMSDRARDSDVTSGVSSSSSYLEARLQNGGRTHPQANHTRNLKMEYLANLKNLQASSC